MRPMRSPENRRHRGEQHRRALDREPRVGEPEAVHPVDLREQPDHLPEGERDADQSTPMMRALRPGLARNATQICR